MHRTITALISAVAITALAAAHGGPHAPAAKPAVYQVQAITTSGDLYIAGEGDTCEAARFLAVYPAHMVKAECLQVRAN